jgi:hypothetical protein
MKIKTLIYSVIMSAAALPWNPALAQSTSSAPEIQPATQVAPTVQLKRTFNPESIKRAKLTRLRKDVTLTDDQVTKVKPIIDAYVNDLQAIKTDASLDSRTKRQKSSGLRQKYESDLDGILNPDQRQKLTSLREERRARLRAARTGTPAPVAEPSGSAETPVIVQ